MRKVPSKKKNDQEIKAIRSSRNEISEVQELKSDGGVGSCGVDNGIFCKTYKATGTITSQKEVCQKEIPNEWQVDRGAWPGLAFVTVEWKAIFWRQKLIYYTAPQRSWTSKFFKSLGPINRLWTGQRALHSAVALEVKYQSRSKPQQAFQGNAPSLSRTRLRIVYQPEIHS